MMPLFLHSSPTESNWRPPAKNHLQYCTASERCGGNSTSILRPISCFKNSQLLLDKIENALDRFA